ncbi:MAG: anthranilate synthase component I family protein, partial [Ghiorsea sp.]
SEAFFAVWKQDLQHAITFDYPTLRDVFYASYEVNTLFESIPTAKTLPVGGLIWRHQPVWCACFSIKAQKIYLSSNQSEQDLDMLEAWLAGKADQSAADQALAIPRQYLNAQAEQAQARHDDYQNAVEKVRQYIRAGDVFQVNIARFWQKRFPAKHLNALYARLRAVNPAPFACFLKINDATLISASPERLFSIDKHGKVSTRPIAGTRKRSDGEQDDALSHELLLSEKERAEHIMLLDLERNDLGRICQPGSIEVDECMVIEKYATVQHIVSNVSGQLAEQYDILDVLKAMFPGGTITGCPKVRCMEIIHEIEGQARGPYTGSVGFMAWDGSVDSNILIRTFWHEKDTLHWAAGAGIVADSVAAHEEKETEHKVAGLMRVFQ